MVWEQSPDLTGDEEEGGERLWTDALEHCFEAKVGGRYGWRMPTIEELTTLLDDTVAPPLIPDALKAITSDVQASGYWSSTSSISDPDGVWHVRFQDAIISDSRPKDGFKYVWCVRGGQGHDAY
ncbi:MAG: DUF1566 domain-containing protein [Pseudomonadales bacterium]|nr:DUF1566 domain-containing protein [Pseudomonadales bacterium]